MPRMKQLGRHRRDRGQPRSAKLTAWRKNRRFGQAIRGDAVGRSADYIPSHALPRPETDEPVLVENRPHANYFFPVTGQEVLARIRQLPARDTVGITHVWLRRMGPKDNRPFGTYNYGPDHAVIVLYPWPKNLVWWLGPRRPSAWWRWLASNFDGVLGNDGGYWYARFSREGARRFFLDQLVLHEVGHHADWREFSSANSNDKRAEEFANQYAVTWARKLRRGDGKAYGPRIPKSDFRHLERVLAAAFPYWNARIEHNRSDGPTPSLTVSFRFYDRRRRVRTNAAWIRPDEIRGLTVEGAQRRVERANQSWQRRPWK